MYPLSNSAQVTSVHVNKKVLCIYDTFVMRDWDLRASIFQLKGIRNQENHYSILPNEVQLLAYLFFNSLTLHCNGHLHRVSGSKYLSVSYLPYNCLYYLCTAAMPTHSSPGVVCVCFFCGPAVLLLTYPVPPMSSHSVPLVPSHPVPSVPSDPVPSVPSHHVSSVSSLAVLISLLTQSRQCRLGSKTANHAPSPST